MKNEKLIVALDVPNLKEAERLVKTLSPVVQVFKIGKELFTSEGPRVVEMVHSHKAKVFLDLKFHDIPNTVGAACASAARLGVFMLNVHALGGSAMLKEAVRTTKTIIGAPLLLGVTVLTSLSDDDLEEVGIHHTAKDEVSLLTRLCESCGLNGVVASGNEIDIVKKAAQKGFVIVTPGVRPLWAALGDQKRVMTPKEALEKGADFIIVGRPVTQSPKPLEAAKRILGEL